MIRVNVQYLIRTAFINYPNRKEQIFFIQKALGVSRDRAKELIFAFIHNAEEEFLFTLANKE